MGSSRPAKRPRHGDTVRRNPARGGRRQPPGSPAWLALACVLLIVLAAVAPTVSANAATEVSAAAEVQPAATTAAAEGASPHDQKMAARRQRMAARREQKEAERAAKRANPKHPFSTKRENAEVTVTCEAVTITYKGFPNAPGNTVNEVVSVEHVHLIKQSFTFTGPEATHTFPFLVPGKLKPFHVDVFVNWRIPGFRGGYDIPSTVKCAPSPAFTIQKLQRIDGTEAPFTTETLAGVVGQTVDYQMLLTNTGNVPLSFGQFVDPRCDAGTITRSTQEMVVSGGTMTYECRHLLTSADLAANVLENKASVTGTPEEVMGKAIEHESNTVLVTPITPVPPPEPEKPAPKEEPKQEVAGTKSSSGGTTESKTGVLGFSSATVPALKGPVGCVRGGFRASIKSAGVASVIFYLDGRKLKALTSKNAHGGVLSILIDPTRLSIGPHKVSAKITMTGKASATSTRPAKAMRSRTVVHCASAVLTPHFTG